MTKAVPVYPTFPKREFPRKSGITIQEVQNHHGETPLKNTSFRVTVPARVHGAGGLRQYFKTQHDAENFADRTWTGCKKQGADYFAVSDNSRREFAAAYPGLKERGISVNEALSFAIRHLGGANRNKTVKELVDELTASKQRRHESGDLRPRSFSDFRDRTKKFADAFGACRAGDITVQDIKGWITGMKNAPRSNANYLNSISEVFTLAKQQDCIVKSPLENLTDVDRKELCGGHQKDRVPHPLTVKEAEKLLKAALDHPELGLLGAVTLGLFCGIRTEELQGLEWTEVRTRQEEPTVIIGPEIAKKRRIRHVDIPANALLWLSLVKDKTGTVSRRNHRADHSIRFKKLWKFAGFKKWPENAMRDSFASHHYAAHGNPLETSRLMGHKSNDTVLFDHYRALTPKKQGEAFFALTPPKKAGKIIKFSATG